MSLPRLILFDLDGTLAESKQKMDAEMAALLTELLAHTKVAVISGGGYDQFERQFLSSFAHFSSFENLYLLPTSGATFYQYEQNTWRAIYKESLSPEEKEVVEDALRKALEESGHISPPTIYGETIEDRGSQISFSANGQDAPLAIKAVWDPDHTKRARIAEFLRPLLPQFSIRIGGTNTIDITKEGVDKAYGIRRIEEKLGIPQADMLFIGDALFPGGNDYAVTETETPWKKVTGSEETKQLIRELLASRME